MQAYPFKIAGNVGTKTVYVALHHEIIRRNEQIYG